jgi:SanA protein
MTLINRFFTNKRILIFVFICFTTILSIPLYVKHKARHNIFANVKNVSNAEFAIVLGAGIMRNGTPGTYLQKRLDDALILYSNKKVEKILLTGDNGSVSHDEISVMNNYLTINGIPQDKIFADYAGFDTYSSMERADKIFEISDAIIVSQYYHLPRTLYIARNKGINATGFVTNSQYGRRAYKFREWFATVKSVFDCLINRKSKFYGKKVNTNGKSNVLLKQLLRAHR